MESQPILYGKDVNTGAIKQLTSVGNLLMLSNKLDDLSDVTISGSPSIGQTLRYNGTQWLNATKDYFHLTVFGRVNTGIYTGKIYQPYGGSLPNQVLILSGANWTNNIPNPLAGYRGYINTNMGVPSEIYSQSVSGMIKLNQGKTYRINATGEFVLDISEITTWYIEILYIGNNVQTVIGFMSMTQAVDFAAGASLNITCFLYTGTDTNPMITLRTKAYGGFTTLPCPEVASIPNGDWDECSFTVTVQEI
jgi:hypothetical protein